MQSFLFFLQVFELNCPLKIRKEIVVFVYYLRDLVVAKFTLTRCVLNGQGVMKTSFIDRQSFSNLFCYFLSFIPCFYSPVDRLPFVNKTG